MRERPALMRLSLSQRMTFPVQMERYFGQPREAKMSEARPELHYQVRHGNQATICCSYMCLQSVQVLMTSCATTMKATATMSHASPCNRIAYLLCAPRTWWHDLIQTNLACIMGMMHVCVCVCVCVPGGRDAIGRRGAPRAGRHQHADPGQQHGRGAQALHAHRPR